MKKIFLGLMSISLIVFLSPIIINHFLARKPPFNMIIASNNDWISFYGSYIGGLMTLIGVVITILFTIFQYKEQDRKRIQPYITINQLYKTKYKNDVKDLTIDDYKMGSTIVFNDSKRNDNDIFIDELALHGELINIGLGTVVHVRINEIKIENKYIKYDTNEYHALTVNEKINFRLDFFKIVIQEKMQSKEYKEFLKKEDSSKIPSIKLKFNITFSDMIGNKYLQNAEAEVQLLEEDGNIDPNVLFQNVTFPKVVNL